MKISEYAEAARSTAIYPGSPEGRLYPIMGLAEEAFEVVEKVWQDTHSHFDVLEKEVRKEMGDVLWMLAALLYECQVATMKVAITRALDDPERRRKLAHPQPYYNPISFGDLGPWLLIKEELIGSRMQLAMELSKATHDIVGKVAKAVRKGVYPCRVGDEATIELLAGKCILKLMALATAYDTTLEEIAEQNLAKLKDRAERGVLEGSGDNR